MPGLDELASRLEQLENGYYNDKEEARQRAFFDRYGGSFSNNHSLGMAILNELDARGIDTSAADEAVQEIVDQLRTESQEIISLLKDVQNLAVQNAEKIDVVDSTVEKKIAQNPEASVDIDASSGDEMPPIDDAAGMSPEGGEMPPEGGEAPMPPEGGEMPPEGGEAPMPPMPPEGGEMPPEGGEVPPPSDVRVKNIKPFGFKRKPKMTKISSNFVNIAKRGF